MRAGIVRSDSRARTGNCADSENSSGDELERVECGISHLELQPRRFAGERADVGSIR